MREGKRVQGNHSPLSVLLLTGIHNRSRKNIIECEIDRSVKNERRIRIKGIAIEIMRPMNDDLGMMARKSWKGSGSG
jgi:hypothetical protein